MVTNAYEWGNMEPVEGLNLFKIIDILEEIETSIEDVRWKGALIYMTASFDVNLNKGYGAYTPSFSFDRIDNQYNTISPGFNLYSAKYGPFTGQDTQTRQLLKRSGIQIVFFANGKTRKFDWYDFIPLYFIQNFMRKTLFTTVSIGLGLLGVAKLICDFILEYFLLDPRQQNLSLLNQSN